MDNYGLKILKRNKPITAIDPRDIQFTSSKNFLRFQICGTDTGIDRKDKRQNRVGNG